jgi:UPF0716 protein FxsA
VFGLLALVFLLVPVAELIVLIKVGSMIGVFDTLALLVLLSLLGAWIVKREGVGLYRRAQRELEAGRVPTSSLVDGILLLAAGALLLTPGFITDAAGVLLLLLPPVRILVRRALTARYRRRARLLRDGVQVRESRFGRIVTVVSVPSSDRHGPGPAGGSPPELEG